MRLSHLRAPSKSKKTETEALTASALCASSGLLATSLRSDPAETEALTASALCASSGLLAASLRSDPAETEPLAASALCASSGLLAASLRSDPAETEALAASALCASSGLLAASLRSDPAETEALAASALCASSGLLAASLRSALESSGLFAEGCLGIHDSGCSDSGKKHAGDCECKNLVHSGLLALYRLRFPFIPSGRFPLHSKMRLSRRFNAPHQFCLSIDN
jgi:hypothetical protein